MGFIPRNGDFCLWFDELRLLHMVSMMTISARLLMNELYPFGVLIIELPLLNGLISSFSPTVIRFTSNNVIPQ